MLEKDSSCMLEIERDDVEEHNIEERTEKMNQ